MADREAITVLLTLAICAGLAASARADVTQTLTPTERRQVSRTVLAPRPSTPRTIGIEAQHNVPQVFQIAQLAPRDETQEAAKADQTASNETPDPAGAQPDPEKKTQFSPRWRQQQALFVIKEPTEVPGAVLEPGTYVIRAKNAASQDSLPGTDILEILNKEGTEVFATIKSMPEYNPPPPGEPQFTYYARRSGQHAALKSWWPAADPYPYEEQFVYPAAQAARLVIPSKKRDLSAPSDTAANPAKSPELTARSGAGGTNILEDSKRASVTTSQQIQSAARPIASAAPPRTAGALPLLAMTALVFVAASLVVKAISSQYAMPNGHHPATMVYTRAAERMATSQTAFLPEYPDGEGRSRALVTWLAELRAGQRELLRATEGLTWLGFSPSVTMLAIRKLVR